jgi:tRNA dimethylallyltransferase
MDHGDRPRERSKVVVIAGPTGSGKTRLGVELGKRFDGEVINADSRYLYRGFTIGTAKPSSDETASVPHHLIDILEPGDDFSLARYQELANAAIAEVRERGHLPLLVGGTPLYINAVIEGWSIPRVPPHPEIRARLETEAAEFGTGRLAARLAAIDPPAAERCGVNLRRIIRALEIHEVTGQRMSDLEGKGPRPYDTLEIGLTAPGEWLNAAIDRRVDDQIARGLVDEVQGLLAAGVPPDAPAFSSIGYRQLLPALRGEITLGAAIERIKFDTRRYVRHQRTWLRANQRLIPIDVTLPDWIERADALVRGFLAAPDPDPTGRGAESRSLSPGTL